MRSLRVRRRLRSFFWKHYIAARNYRKLWFYHVTTREIIRGMPREEVQFSSIFQRARWLKWDLVLPFTSSKSWKSPSVYPEMRKNPVSFLPFFVVITIVLMTFVVTKSFVQRANRCRWSLSSGSFPSTHRISTHTTTHRLFSSSVDSNDVMSYLQQPPHEHEIHALSTFLSNKRNVCVITGAGVSTSSGIPDYRGPQGSYKLGHKPMVSKPFILT